MAFYGFLYLMMCFLGPAEWGRAFGAMGGVYALGFVGVVAGYFWARWFAIGIGTSGLISAVISMWQVGPEPTLMFYGGTQMLIPLVMCGGGMAKLFDGRTEWRDKFHHDEGATNRLGKAVIRVGISLPYIVLYALAPRGVGESLAMICGAGLAGIGLWALIRNRTWGVFALGGGAVALLSSLGMGPQAAAFDGHAINLVALGAAATVLLIAAVIPFAGPVARYLRS